MLLLVDLRVLEVESPLVVCVVADGQKLSQFWIKMKHVRASTLARKGGVRASLKKCYQA